MKLFAKLFILSLQSLYFIMKPLHLSMSFLCSNLEMVINCCQHKICYSIISLNSIEMVNVFPRLETSTQVFGDYKAMFGYISSNIRHRIKEIIWVNFNPYITVVSLYFATFPTTIIRTTLPLGYLPSLFRGKILPYIFAGTGLASRMHDSFIKVLNPSLFTTINTSSPYTSASFIFAIMWLNITNLRHDYKYTITKQNIQQGFYKCRA